MTTENPVRQFMLMNDNTPLISIESNLSLNEGLFVWNVGLFELQNWKSIAYIGHRNNCSWMKPFWELFSVYPIHLPKNPGNVTLIRVQKRTQSSMCFFKSFAQLLLFPKIKFWTAYEIYFKIHNQHFWCASFGHGDFFSVFGEHG